MSFRPVEEKSESFVFLEYQQNILQSFHEFGMDWYRFWNTLNLKPDICIAQIKKNLKGILLTLQKYKLPDSTSTRLNDIYTRRYLQKSESWTSWWPVLWPVQSPKQAYKAKSVQHLASHGPKGLVSLWSTSWSCQKAKLQASHEALNNPADG